MVNPGGNVTPGVSKRQGNKNYQILGSVVVVSFVFLLAAIGIINGQANKNGNLLAAGTNSADKSDLRILKSEVTNIAKFYSYTVNGVKLEVIAVKASDGTVRTALNTCQVCYDSGRGFYTQQGNELICNNCGNRFKIDQIEKQKFGCNPIPIFQEDKTDNGKYIIISRNFLAQNTDYFRKWKK